MGEVNIECTCDECGTDFDEYSDCINCSVCEYSVCEDCQPEHAVKHCFENNDAMKRPEEKKKVFRK